MIVIFCIVSVQLAVLWDVAFCLQCFRPPVFTVSVWSSKLLVIVSCWSLKQQ